MGSITGILFNIPGNSSAAAVLLDGHALSRNGLPRTALLRRPQLQRLDRFSVLVLMALMPIVREFILEFGPWRGFAGHLGFVDYRGYPELVNVKAIAVTMIGLVLAMVGTDPVTAAPAGPLELSI